MRARLFLFGMIRRFPIALACLLSLCVPTGARAQTGTPTAEATSVSGVLTLDGRLEEPAWDTAQAVTSFRQRDPHEGQPSTESTVVKLLYDEAHLYVGARLLDSEPGRILATELARDGDFDGDDRFAVLLDTFGDRRNAVLLRVNPNGARFDAVIRNESRVDDDWDEQWWVETHVDEHGWTVEMQIPFKILRFDTASGRAWGVNFERIIRRKNEATYWTNWDRDFEFTHVSQAGLLRGLAPARPGQRIRLRPYVLTGVESLAATDPPRAAHALGDVGIDDLQIALAPNLTANVAVNPDFAQTEIDEQRINLTRFSLFFPEKRQFFVQGADSLRMSPPLDNDGESLQLFHSRQVGLSAAGEPIPLIAGGKLTGKVRSIDVGAFGGRTGADDGAPGETFGVVRFRREILGRSYVGAISTVRDGAGAARSTLGADARFVLADHLAIGAMAARADNDQGGAGWARYLAAEWESDIFEADVSHLNVDPDFDPALGFVRRHDRQTDVRMSANPRPSRGPIRQFEISPSASFNHGESGRLVSREVELSVGAELHSGDEIDWSLEQARELLPDPFEIEDGIVLPAGRYGWRKWRLELDSFDGRRLSGRASIEGGGFYNGTRRAFESSATLRLGRHLRLSPDYEVNDVSLAEGNFTTHLFGLRSDVAFSRDAAASTFFQYRSDGRLAAFQVRFTYILRNIDNLYIVYNETRVTGGPGSHEANRSLVAKMTYSLHR